VMRCGCQRENFFEGCEGRSEERCGRPDAGQSLFGGIGQRAEAAEAKRGEPLPVPGCNKPGTLMRRKPSRWCETTGMERADRVEPACRRQWQHCWEWTQESLSDEGRIHTTNLTRGKSQGGGQPHSGHFGPIRVALETRPSTREAHERGKTLRTRSETSKVERGAAKSKRAATESMAGTHHIRKNVEGPTHSEVHVNVTRAATTINFGCVGVNRTGSANL
jgi:hypothetical protein